MCIRDRVYKEYQKRLKQNNALDFDDLIMLTVQLFRQNAEILNHYQERFPFILVAGYGKGMELVGRFYNRGIYVERDRRKAEYWLQKAIESPDPDACTAWP